MIDLDKWQHIDDMSTLKFAKEAWPQLVRELRAARRCVRELRYARPRHPDAGRALAAYEEACRDQ